MSPTSMRSPRTSSGEGRSASSDVRVTEAAEAELLELLPRVRRWVYAYCGRRHDAEDLVQEALAEVAAAMESFEGRAKFSTFAHRVVMRTLARELGRRRRHEAHHGPEEALEPASTEPDAEREAMHREAVRQLYVALDALSETARRAFVLCAIERLPLDEAAEIEGLSVDALRKRLMRARADVELQLARLEKEKVRR